MPTLLVLDHSFHEKTKSTEFFSLAWAEAGWSVINLFDGEWQGEPALSPQDVQQYQPDLLVSFQVLKPADFYRQTKCKNILLIPMYDSAGGMKAWDWWEYRDFTILHFSKRLHRRLSRLGIPGVYLQYFPDPKHWIVRPWEERTGDLFFWQRRAELVPSTVLNLFQQAWPRDHWNLHWHRATDPGETTDSLEQEGIRITETTWFRDRAEYGAVVENHKVFVAPRLTEGIGMSFLEAMALGCVVIGNRDATMDEYIVHGCNGVLVDWMRPYSERFSAEQWEEMSKGARKAVELGFVEYRNRLTTLIENWEPLSNQQPFWTPMRTAAGVLSWLRLRVLRPLKHLLRRR